MDDEDAIRRPMVLLVDDSETNRAVLTRMLEQIGCTVTAAVDGAAAVAAARTITFDAILMDCQMPVMDGYEATRQIRAQEQGPRVPIVAITASAMPHVRQAITEAGMDGYLLKPPSLDQLRDAVTSASDPSGEDPAG